MEQKAEVNVGDRFRARSNAWNNTFAPSGSTAMPLSSMLRPVDLTLECKHCGHPITKPGRWFISVHRFNCEGCNREVLIPYSDKVALFNKHARPSQPKPRSRFG
jgi:hypothetical protein